MAKLTNQYALNKIKEAFGDHITDAAESYGMLTVSVNKDSYFDLIKFLKEDADLNCMFLTDLTGIHDPNRINQELGVVVHLHNLTANFRIRIKTFASTEHHSIKSLTSLFKGANWMERETFDFFGIHFSGHPNMKRILNVDDMDYHPLLKQYPMEDQTREDKNNKYFGR